MSFGICDLAVIPLRAEPSDKSELVSQLLFGETFEILLKEKQWLSIRNHDDQYEGWLDEKQIRVLSPEQFSQQQIPVAVLNDTTAEASSAERSMLLLVGSSLPAYANGEFMIGNERFRTEGDVNRFPNPNLSQRIPWFAVKFAGTPYLWGGRSLFGLDCSGFTQLVFKLAGIQLRRDAWQQSEQGILVSFVDQARPGDLAFFQNEEGRVTHVGIILTDHKIIHASGRVRTDTIDHYGIYNEEQKKYTHQLRLIRRILSPLNSPKGGAT